MKDEGEGEMGEMGEMERIFPQLAISN